MSIFRAMPGERLTFIKKDGRRFENVRAIVASGKILTEDPKMPIEEGDEFERPTPSGVVERYTVLDAGFQPGMPPAIPAHYQSKVQKNTALPRTPQHSSVVYNLVGAHSRVNIHSTDSSTNVVSVNSTELFTNLRQAIQQSSSLASDVSQRLVEHVDAMESAAGTKNYAERYKEFIGVAADHMTLAAPFLQALTQLLT